MKRMHLVWVLLCCIDCGGGSFSADDHEADGGDVPTESSDDASGVGGSYSDGSSSGGVVGSGGSPHVDASPDAQSGGSGGSDLGGAGGTTGDAGGVGGAGGCELVTHDNGLGQTWQDCVPLYTFNIDQALKACGASSATACFGAERCGVGEVRGLIGDASAFFAEWGYEGFAAGLVSPTYNLCGGSSDPANRQWR